MLQGDVLHWYEDTLPSGERKKRGHFSTPPLLVERILDACGYTSQADLSHIRVLDPACGSGNFLAGAARRLLAMKRDSNAAVHQNEDLLTPLTYVEHNLWGFDPDPVACFLAEMQLQTILTEHGAADTHSPEVSSPQLHIHQADALALPWGTEGEFDLLVANPPYLAAKNSDLSGYRATHQHGQVDSYLLFVKLALQMVRSDGWMGLVVPDALLARTNAAEARRQLLEQVTIHHLWHLSEVFSAHVGAVVIIGQKRSPRSTHQVLWVREQGCVGCVWVLWADTPVHQYARQHTIPQILFSNQPRAELRYLLSAEHASSIRHLQEVLLQTDKKHVVPLGDTVIISRGEEIGRESPYLFFQPAPLVEQSPASGQLSSEEKQYYPVLRGGVDIHPYSTPQGEWWIAREHIQKPVERYLTPKLLIVKSTGHLQAALDTHGHVALQTLYLLRLRSPEAAFDELYFYLGLLNSRFLREYVSVLYTAYKWVQPQIEQHVLTQLPVPPVPPVIRQQIIERAKLLMHSRNGYSSFNTWSDYSKHLFEEQEQAITGLYESLFRK